MDRRPVRLVIGLMTLAAMSAIVVPQMFRKWGNASVYESPTKWKQPLSFKLSDSAAKLPNVNGYGRLKDLAASATTDPDLLALVRNYVASSASADAESLVSGFENLLFAWAGVDKLDPESRGKLMDARKLEFMSAFYNDGYYDFGVLTRRGHEVLYTEAYTKVRDGLLTRFLIGVPPAIWRTTADEKQAYASRFMPLQNLGLTPENQLEGNLANVFRDVFKRMPEDDAQARAYLDVMLAALAGARNELASSSLDDAVLPAAAESLGRNAERAILVFRQVLKQYWRKAGGGALVVSSSGRGNRDDYYIWSGGAAIIDETSATGGSGDKLLLPDVRTREVSLIRTGADITLVIAPSGEGREDGGSVKLLNVTPSGERGVETIILADDIWTQDDLLARARGDSPSLRQ